MPRPARIFLWVSGIVGLALFLTPGFYVLKYYAFDKPGEDRRAAAVSLAAIPENDPLDRLSLETSIAGDTATNIALQCRVARSDAEPNLRIFAVNALGKTVGGPGTNFEYPMECLLAKYTLADIATHDPDPRVRTAASDALGAIAEHGAVILR
jgi:hypothetical protein